MSRKSVVRKNETNVNNTSRTSSATSISDLCSTRSTYMIVVCSVW